MLVSSWTSFNNTFFTPSHSKRRSSVYTSPSLHNTSMPCSPTDQSSLAGSPNAVSQRDPLSESKNIPLATNSAISCLDKSSDFFKVLTAPYTPSPPIMTEPEEYIDPREAERCLSVIDWSRAPERLDSPVDEEDAPATVDPSYYDHVNRAVYKPHGHWAWADGLAIEDSSVLTHLGTGRMCSAVIKNGVLGGRRITFISKSWLTQEQDMWQGFHSELALYKSEQYLRPLQGVVVPTIIGVHVLPGEINVAMEPPHHSFWIEASADMPIVLKERCIEAFERLHSVGILHGDVELRHMLIGGDGKVTIIDFQRSRTLIPNDGVMLQKAEPADFLMEMRKVKYKLDYGESREKELQKVIMNEERSARNRLRQYKHKRRSRGERPGYISEYEDDPKEDKTEPPVHKQDWNEHWVVGSNETPHRFVMPGQTPEQLEHEVQHLSAVIHRMQLERSRESSTQDCVQILSTPPPTPTTQSGSEENTDPSSLQSTDGSHNYCLRKRKATALSISPSKRPRSKKAHSTTSTSRDGTSSISEAVNQQYAKPLDGSLSSTITPDPISDTSQSDESSVLESIPSDKPPAIPSSRNSSPTPRYPPIKVRDFAYEPYDGPRGYYVPHPPTEARAARERQWHIARLNAQKCLEHNLPHPVVLAHLCGDAQIFRLDKKKPMVQFGNLKRAREDMENPEGARTWSAHKKARYEVAKKAMNGEITTNEGMQEGHVILHGLDIQDELLDIPEGPRILSKAEYEAHFAVAAPPTNHRSILHKTSPVRLVSQHREEWIGSQLEKSPKLGPEDLYFGNVGTSVMLGVHYDALQDDFDGNLSGGSQLNRNVDRAGDMMALATLGFKLTGSKPSPSEPRLPNSSRGMSTADGFARSDTLKNPIGPPPQRKKVQNATSRGASSSAPCSKFHRSPLPPPPCQDSEDEQDEQEVDTLLSSLDVDASPRRSWMSTLLRLFRP